MKKVIVGILGGVSVVVLIGLYMYNKPHKNMSKVTPDYVLTTQELSINFGSDEKSANELYLGKIIEVRGEVLSDRISSSNQRIIMLKGDEFINVQCSFPNQYNIEKPLENGEAISIKGACTGMLLDVIMNDCVIVKKK